MAGGILLRVIVKGANCYIKTQDHHFHTAVELKGKLTLPYNWRHEQGKNRKRGENKLQSDCTGLLESYSVLGVDHTLKLKVIVYFKVGFDDPFQ